MPKELIIVDFPEDLRPQTSTLTIAKIYSLYAIQFVPEKIK